MSERLDALAKLLRVEAERDELAEELAYAREEIEDLNRQLEIAANAVICGGSSSVEDLACESPANCTHIPADT